MQILEIVLFGHNGKKRTIKINAGRVNIITGKSATGKSTIIQIIDYCLGASRCDVPEGIIREKVSWYGLLVAIENERCFVARENPQENASTTNKAFMISGPEVNSPAAAPTSNTTIEAAVESLGQKIGIGENKHFPPEGQTRAASSATLRHGLMFCFQDQDVIASKNVLFHKQAEPFIPQSIKDTMPYLLGAVNEDHLSNLHELAKSKRQFAVLSRELQDSNAIKGSSFNKAFSLVEEARNLGIAPESKVETIEEAHVALAEIAKWKNQESPSKVPISTDYLAIQDEAYQLEDQIRNLDERINTAKHFSQGATGFSGEAREQVLRLKSIGLFERHEVAKQCPVCNSDSDGTEVEKQIKASISQLHKELEIVTKEKPKINEYVVRLEKEKEQLAQQFSKKQRELEGLLASQSSFRAHRDRSVRIGMALGKVSLWLESVRLTTDDADLKRQIEKWSHEIKRLEALVDSSRVEELMASIINRISNRMTTESAKLPLEHQGNPVRFDIKDLTVVVDLEDKPVPLKRIGSGENHVGYHLIALTAFHDHFVKNNRPVPRFLVLDQPSQVYYPPEKQETDGSLKKIADADKIALTRMYNFIFDFCANQNGNFQIILLDHAKPNEPTFIKHIVEEWRGTQALIPANW
jgi:energy-coupling factor transporter ATP-binding protein EcfA2/predicted DNA-binding ArsR family transcriptional regulator